MLVTGVKGSFRAKLTETGSSVLTTNSIDSVTNGTVRIFSADGTSEEWARATLASGTLTFTIRGMDRSTFPVPTANTSNDAEWPAGSKFEFVISHVDLNHLQENSHYVGDTTDSNKRIYARNGDSNMPFVGYDAINNVWVISHDGINTITISGAGGVNTASNGIQLVASDIQILFATDPGLEINSNGVRVKVHSAAATKLQRTSAGVGIDPSVTPTWTGAHIFNSTVNIATATNWLLGGVAFTGTMAKINLFAGTEAGTAGEAINASSTPQAVYIDTSTGKVLKSKADDATKRTFYGFVGGSQNVALDAAVQINRHGLMSGFSGLTAGSYYFVTNTAGSISATPGDAEICVGRALSTSVIDLDDKPQGMAYISSVNASGVTTGSTITAPADARIAIVTLYAPAIAGGEYSKGEVILTKIGRTSATWGIGSSGAGDDTEVAASWSGNTITLTSTKAGVGTDMGNTCTAQFYR